MYQVGVIYVPDHIYGNDQSSIYIQSSFTPACILFDFSVLIYSIIAYLAYIYACLGLFLYVYTVIMQFYMEKQNTLVSVRVCANVCTNNIMINRNASCYVSIIYDEKWLLLVFFSICLRACRPLYIKILRFKRVLFLQIYNCTAFMFKQFCVRTQLHI